VANPTDSPYRKGRASGWLKIKTPHEKWNER